MARVYLVEGPVGAGKSTYAIQLSREIHAPHLNIDAWMVTLFRQDRPASDGMRWYSERKARCIKQMLQVARSIIHSGSDVILELGLVQRQARQEVYQQLQLWDLVTTVHVLDLPREERLARVRDRNLDQGSTYSMEVSDDMFDLADAMWEAPDDIECDEQEIVFV